MWLLHFSLSCRQIMLSCGFIMWLGKPYHSKLKIKGEINNKEWENEAGCIQKAVILTIQWLLGWESSLSQTHTLRAVGCPCEPAQCVGNEGSPLPWHQLILHFNFERVSHCSTYIDWPLLESLSVLDCLLNYCQLEVSLKKLLNHLPKTNEIIIFLLSLLCDSDNTVTPVVLALDHF